MLKIKRYNRLNESEDYSSVSISSSAMQNVRDMASRRNFDPEWAKSIQPLLKLSDEEIVQRYYAALFVYGVKEFPKSVADVARIGIFQNYMFKLFDNGFTSAQLQNMSDAYFKYIKDNFVEMKPKKISDTQQPSQSSQRKPSGIDRIKALSPEERQKNFKTLFDPENNKKRVANFPDTLSIDSNGNISMMIGFKDENTGESKKVKLSGKTFGELMYKFSVIAQASVMNMTDTFFSVSGNDRAMTCYKIFHAFSESSDDYLEKEDSKIEELYFTVFANSKSLDDLLNKLKKFKF